MPSNARDHKRPTAAPAVDEAAAWEAMLSLRNRARTSILAFPIEIAIANARLTVQANGAWRLVPEAPAAVAQMIDLYLPLVLVPHRRSFVLAHLAQSLDGRIATTGGDSQWLTGEADLDHTHRLRALADAVIVGAATVRQDDPRLTVRRCTGNQPVRVVLDPNLTTGADRHVFSDGAAPTLVLAAADSVGKSTRLGAAEILPLPRDGDRLAPRAICALLAERGLHWLFVEGGGMTVSGFLAAGVLDRLQIALAPVILGSGRPSLQLPEIGALAGALRPRVRHFRLGDDVMVECVFRD
jgi:diaminohydroxyphosphoribosylaminopyrimidine deaminase / 5-amino-6-(5-phosphoribosylamino)uracil reductase